MNKLFDIGADFLEDYNGKDLIYKDQARQILVDRLGYEPPLRASALSEMILRAKLRKLDNKERLDKPLEEWIDFHVNFVNKLMMEHLESFNC